MSESKISTTGPWIFFFIVLVLTAAILLVFVTFYRPIETAVLVAAVIAAIIFPVLTIMATYFCTQENISELRSSTDRQIEVLNKGFSKQIENTQKSTERQSEILQKGFQAVIIESQEQSKSVLEKLGETTETISRLSEYLDEKLEAIEAESEGGRQRLDELKELEEQRKLSEMEHVERMQPVIMGTLSVRSHSLFWKHRHLHIANIGGHGIDLQVSYRYHERMDWKALKPEGFELRMNQSKKWDLGDISKSGDSNAVLVSISARDEEQRLYKGELTISLGMTKWMQFPLKQQSR